MIRAIIEVLKGLQIKEQLVLWEAPKKSHTHEKKNPQNSGNDFTMGLTKMPDGQ